MDIDLAVRTTGLLSPWSLVAFGVLAVGALVLAGRLRSRWPWLRAEVGAVVTLVVAHLLFFWRPLFTSAQVPRGGGDLLSYAFPLHAFAATQFQAGAFPLWNPTLKGGMPQLANLQAGMLYPPNLLAWLLARPFTYSVLELMVIGHFLIASLGAYALARSLGLRPLPAVLSGIVFAYSGFLTAHLGHYQMITVAVWLPLLLLTVRQLVLTRSWLWTAAAGAVLFFATTAGHQPALLYELTLAAIWWLYWTIEREGLWRGALERDWGRVAREHASTFTRSALQFAGALAMGLSLAAPVIIPSLQLSAHSVRSSLDFDRSTEYSAQPVVLLHFILPKVFGSNPTDWWGAFASGEVWGYVGVVTLMLAGLALAVRPSGVRLLLAGLAGVALVYALGPFTPLQGWVYRFVPLYDLVRAPGRAFLVVDLCLALLAGFGLQALREGADHDPRLPRILRLSMRALLIWIGVLALFILPLFYSLIFDSRDAYNRPVIVVDGLNMLLLILVGAAMLLWAIASARLGASAAGALVLLLVVFDLFSATAGFNPSSADITGGLRHPEAVTYLRQELARAGPYRIEGSAGNWQPDLAAVVGLNDIGGLFDPMQARNYDRAYNAVVSDRSLPLYDLFGVRYLITDDQTDPGPGFRSVLHTSDGLVIWQNDGAVPRVWLSATAQTATTDAALAAALSPSFDPRGDLYVSGPGSESIRPDASATGSATIIADEADRVLITVETSAPAVLVLNDIDYPGWVATVDGKPASIVTANGLFRAVAVPAGTHEVEFRFQQPYLNLSLGIAGAGMLWGLTMLVLGVRQRLASRQRPIL